MRLKNLIEKTPWQEVASKLIKIYKVDDEVLAKFALIYKGLLTRTPEESQIEIAITKVQYNNLEYIQVLGYNIKKPEVTSPLDLMPWGYWLGMSISIATLADYTRVEIIAHCLYEMTRVGDENDIKERLRIIAEVAEKIEEDHKAFSTPVASKS